MATRESAASLAAPRGGSHSSPGRSGNAPDAQGPGTKHASRASRTWEAAELTPALWLFSQTELSRSHPFQVPKSKG